MNQTIAQLHARKSVRVYEDRPIEAEVKQAILEAAIQAPSAGNMALYTILDITDPAMKAALAKSCDDQPFIATAPMVLIFCADYRRWYDAFGRYVPDVRHPGMGDLFLAQADAIIAAQNAVVAAESFGVGSCYIGDIIEKFEYHKELLNLPQYVVPAAMLCFGYPTAQQIRREKPARFKVEGGMYTQFTTLFSYDSNPLIFAGVNGLGNREVVFGFDLHKSDFPLSSDFTALVANLLEYSCPDILTHTDYVCGEDAEINITANIDSVKTISPDGEENYLDTSTDIATFNLDRVGTYTVKVNTVEGEKVYKLYSAAPESESNPNAIGNDFSIGGEQTYEKTDGEYDPVSLFFVLLALVFCADWMVYCYEKYQLR